MSRIPHVFVLLTAVILLASVLSWIIPSGSYQRQKAIIDGSTRTLVNPGTYSHLEKSISLKGMLVSDRKVSATSLKASPVSLLDFLTSIPRGMASMADIIFLIFIVGGTLGVLSRSGTITASINYLLRKFSRSAPLLTIVLMTVIGIAGSTIGMGEELIPLVPIFLLVSAKLGYDRVYGLSIVYLGALIGFAAATTNPFTIQIAQGIAEVPLGSGLGFRIIFFVVIMTITIVYLLRYGRIIKRDPSRSVLAGQETETTGSPSLTTVTPSSGSSPGNATSQVHEAASPSSQNHMKLKWSHVWIVLSSTLIFALIVWAIQTQGWWLNEMSGGFILIGMIATLISGLKLSEAVKAFVKGMEEMVVAALVVGFASGIKVVLEDGQILDTIIYAASNMLGNANNIWAAEGMLVFQTVLNLFIPSGSGQAAVTMPIMAPLADVLGLTRQTAVFAFTCGDGFSNTIIPTSGILMAMLSLAKIPYERWLKFMLPLFLILMFIAGLFIAAAVIIAY